LQENGIGCIPFSPLAQGLLTDRYLNGTIPLQSRAAKEYGALQKRITSKVVNQLTALNELAKKRGQSLAQMALSCLLKRQKSYNCTNWIKQCRTIE
jgi:L-glyceraldehyde 3-phosphate reductase